MFLPKEIIVVTFIVKESLIFSQLVEEQPSTSAATLANPNTNAAQSSDETVISVPLDVDVEGTIDGFQESTVTAGPIRSPAKPIKICKGKCPMNSPCSQHI